MKKSMIWILGGVMAFSFLILLYLQVSYIEEIIRMRQEQFNESVKRSLVQACKNIELVETKKYLEADVEATERRRMAFMDSIVNDTLVHRRYAVTSSNGLGSITSFEVNINRRSNIPKAIISTGKNIPQTSKALQDILKERYVYQRAMLDEVVYNILYNASDKPLRQRINFNQLDAFLKSELLNNGIDIAYHYTVTERDGSLVYRCPDYKDEGSKKVYTQEIFRNDPPAKIGLVNVHFPELNKYIFSSVKFMYPSLIFTLVLLVTFIFTIYIIFRQKTVPSTRASADTLRKNTAGRHLLLIAIFARKDYLCLQLRRKTATASRPAAVFLTSLLLFLKRRIQMLVLSWILMISLPWTMS